MQILFSALFIFLLAVAGISRVAVIRGDQQAGESAAVAMSVGVYSNFVSQYARANPTYSGTVANASLSLPPYFAPRAAVRNYVAAGVAYVFVPPGVGVSPGQVLAALAPDCSRCGVKQGSSVLSPSGLVITAAPGAIPDGSTVRVL